MELSTSTVTAYENAQANDHVTGRLPNQLRWLTFVLDLRQSLDMLRKDSIARAAVFLTFLKAPLILAIFGMAVAGSLTATAVLLVTAIIIDIFDGVIFRSSTLGSSKRLVSSRAVFDVHLDRVLMAATVIPLFLFHSFPVHLLGLIIVRETFLSILLAHPFYANGVLYKANMPSKIATALLGITTAVFCVYPSYILPLTLLFIPFGIYGIAQYWTNPQLQPDQSI